MTEWPIKDVAKASGITSRTLRHYEQIGLLQPARVGHNGYRFYGDAELARLYRILSLRALEMPLASIQAVLDEDLSLAEAMTAPLALLEERSAQMQQHIAAVRHTLDAVTKGQTMSITEIFANFDNSKYEAEVRERWGDNAWEQSAKRRAAMSDAERQADDQHSLDVNAALRSAAERELDPASTEFQELVSEHYRWIAQHWGGKLPSAEVYLNLADMYVADPRFAATYGGQHSAELIREAIVLWIAANLS